MPPWLNPLNWFKLVSALRALVAGAVALMKAISDALLKRDVEKRKEEVDQVAKEIEQAKEIKDDDKRLKAKADAICKLEKIANPDSDCDKPASPGSKV